jgi:serine phosphatase RsbU (regulator of sigma subunit)
MADVRAALRAYAILEGTSPARLITHLDRLVAATGLGKGTTVLYIALHPFTGEMRLANAGHCPPLAVERDQCRFVGGALSGPLGMESAPRPEKTLRLGRPSTLLLFTDGLVRSHNRPMEDGLERLRRRAASDGAGSVDDLCDGVLKTCTAGLRPEEDISLLALRLPRRPEVVPPSPT